MRTVLVAVIAAVLLAPAAAEAARSCPDVRGEDDVHAEGPRSVVFGHAGRLRGCLRGRTVDLGPGGRATIATVREPFVAVATRASTDRTRDRVRVADLRTGRFLARATLPRVRQLSLRDDGLLAAITGTRSRTLWIVGRRGARVFDRDVDLGVGLDAGVVSYRRRGVPTEALLHKGCSANPVRRTGRWRLAFVELRTPPDPDPYTDDGRVSTLLTSCVPGEGLQRVVATATADRFTPDGGFERLLVSGRYVLTVVPVLTPRSDPFTWVQAMDLETGEQWYDESSLEPVRAFLAPNGAAVLSWRRPAYASWGEPQLRLAGGRGDQPFATDPALDPDSLQVTGTTASWTVAGVAQQAELPAPGRCAPRQASRRSVSREGWTRFGSPGIFGYSGGYGMSPSPCSS